MSEGVFDLACLECVPNDANSVSEFMSLVAILRKFNITYVHRPADHSMTKLCFRILIRASIACCLILTASLAGAATQQQAGTPDEKQQAAQLDWRDVEPPAEPQVAAASSEAEQAISGFAVPENWSIQLFAAEPDVANPVAFDVDARGRVFVCETFRQVKGVEDNRSHRHWLEDDLRAQSN